MYCRVGKVVGNINRQNTDSRPFVVCMLLLLLLQTAVSMFVTRSTLRPLPRREPVRAVARAGRWHVMREGGADVSTPCMRLSS